MAPPGNDEEPKFRFRVKIMPPRRPTNSLFKRLQTPKAEEPLHTIAVPARASETFADVWKHIKERYERNYTVEEVAKGWFHKLQDRYGADIDSHDGVGELGYTTKSPREDLVLIMLQNGIDRDGSVPETSGLRPPGFTRPELSEEQEQQAKRRKIEEERYGVALEDANEDTPIESRERSLGPGSPELGAQDDGDNSNRIDADGFAVPLLPGSVSRKRKRPRTARGDFIPSSMEGENDEDILVQDSQITSKAQKGNPEIPPNDIPGTRARIMHSMPADAAASTTAASERPGRARSTASNTWAEEQAGPLQMQRLAALQAPSSRPTTDTENARPKPRSPPTPVSANSPSLTQQPPESAQRPKSTPLVTLPPVDQNGQRHLLIERDAPEDGLDFDPIEDDDLLQATAGTANDDSNAMDIGPGLQSQESQVPISSASLSARLKPGKLGKPSKQVNSTPKASASKQSTFAPGSNVLNRLSGTQGSTSKNPRSSSGVSERWTSEEDNFLLQGVREGLTPAETTKKFGIEGRTASAVRGRRALLIKQNPGIDKGASESTPDGARSGLSATKRKSYSVDEKQVISRAIAKGFDALEIHALHFPGRSTDSINRIVLSLQDQAWKAASMDALFPNNGAQLDGWTLKDGCKLRRTYYEGLTTEQAKKTYFGRWRMHDVQRQMDAYSAQIETLKAADLARASQASGGLKKAVYGSSQVPVGNSQLLVNSSPVERSMQARAARRFSGDVPQLPTGIDVPSSPPQAVINRPSPIDDQAGGPSSKQVQRSSSPTVDVTKTEQISAYENNSFVEHGTLRRSASRPSSCSGRQTTLTFSRDKGKKRAGEPRPTTGELDAQYARGPTSSSTDRPPTQAQQIALTDVSNEHDATKHDGVSDDDQHSPAHDLEMLDATLEQEKSNTQALNGSIDPGGVPDTPQVQPASNDKTPHDNLMVEQSMHQDESLPGGRRQSASTGLTMQSPITTSSTSSGRRRRSRVELGVDTRAAAQLSQELNRSLSREAQEEAAHEAQVFSTPDPKINTYRRAKPVTAVVSEDTVPLDESKALEESVTSRTQVAAATRFRRTSRVTFRDEQSPRSTNPGPDRASKTPVLRPSPRINGSASGVTRTTTPATTPVKPGKLPNRGQSHASRIMDIHRPTQSTSSATARVPDRSPSNALADDTAEPALDKRSPSPTDASIWEKTANADALGRDRKEYFEDLKISTFSIRAIGRSDWDEVKRLKAEERRLHKQRKIARGDKVPSSRDIQHPDGPAQAGDAENADEDVIRVDDDSDVSSEIGEDYDEKIWSDADFEQQPDVDNDRHFSEVEDDEVPETADGHIAEAIEETESVDRSQQVSEINGGGEDMDPVAEMQEAPQTDDVDLAGEAEEPTDELDLPTKPAMPELNGSASHALTDDNLQELNNSGAEGSPARLTGRKRKADQESSNAKSRHDKQLPGDRAVMPPPPNVSTKTSKRKKRRRRHSTQYTSKSGSERSSSFSYPHASSDVPQQQAPSTPVRSEPSAHRSKRARTSETTPAKQTPKVSQTQTQRTAAGSQKAPSSSMRASQRSSGGSMMGLSGLVRNAHIPTPPRVKRTPQKEKKLDIRAGRGGSDESSDSD